MGTVMINEIDRLKYLKSFSDTIAHAEQPIVACAYGGRITYCSDAFCDLTGYSRQQLFSMSWPIDLVPLSRIGQEREMLEALLRTGIPRRYETEYRRMDGSIVPVEVVAFQSMAPDGTVLYYGFASDLRERKRSEMLESALDRITAAINSTMDVDRIMRRMAEETAGIIGYETVAVSLRDGADWITGYEFGVPRVLIGKKLHEDGVKAASLAAASGKTIVIRDAWTDLRVDNQKAKAHGLRSFINAPLVLNGEVIGVLAFINLSPGGPDMVQVDFTDKLASRLSIAIANARMFEAARKELQERKLAEEALRYSEEKHRGFIEQSFNGIVLTDSEGTIVECNKAALEITGMRPERMAGRKIWDVLIDMFGYKELGVISRGQLKARMLEPISKGAASSFNFQVENILIRPDGGFCYLQTIIFPIHTSKGVMVGSIIHDDTQYKLAERALKESEERYRLLAETADDFIYIIDRDMDVAYINRSAAAAIGQAPEALMGKSIESLFPPETNAIMKSSLLKVFETGEPVSTEHINKFYNKDYWLHVKLNPLKDANGLVTAVLSISRDFTGRKNAERALDEARAQAELYVDLMGHDINNMNQVAMGYLELALETLKNGGRLGKDDEHLLAKPYEVLTNSSLLIDNVRKVRKEQAGGYKPRVIDLGALLSEVRDQYSDIAGRNVAISYTPVEGYFVKANELLKDVFSNIVGNAIKHSAGPLKIDIELTDVEQEGCRYHRVSVADDGPGIPDGLKEQLLSRACMTRTRSSGKGFGLCLIKMLLDDFNARFWIEDSVKGDYTKGCRFVVMMPSIEP